MGIVADKSHFQIKMLNNSKGPAVRSLRAQADKKVYPKVMLEYLENTPNLDIKEGMVEDLIIENNMKYGLGFSQSSQENKMELMHIASIYNKYGNDKPLGWGTLDIKNGKNVANGLSLR